MNYHDNNMNKKRQLRTRRENIIIGKQDYIELYDKGKRNMHQNHIPSYYGGM